MKKECLKKEYLYDIGLELKKEFRLSDEDAYDIIKEMLNFSKIFFDKSRIINKEPSIKFVEITNLVLHYGIDSHDANIISNAVNEKCNYFITQDSDLIEKIKKI